MIEYQYGGQWFDDMGSLALFFKNDPMTGVDISRAGLTRDQSNDLAQQLADSGTSGYEEGPEVGI